MTGGLTVLCSLIAVGNIHDPETNFQFVQHVLSMDTVLPLSVMASHALRIPMLWTAGFWLIVIGKERQRSCSRSERSSYFAPEILRRGTFITPSGSFSLAAGCAFLIWFVGFITVGGEWFAMWQSQVWNGQQAAFRLGTFIGAGLAFAVGILPEGPSFGNCGLGTVP